VCTMLTAQPLQPIRVHITGCCVRARRRFRTEAHGDVVGRFNERFMLSLADCGGCLICDDELNILPLSSRAKSIVALPPVDEDSASPEQAELTALKASLEGTPPIGMQQTITT
jgi:N-acetyltransferase 10